MRGGLALLGRGRCLIATGRRAEAEEPLAAARDIFAQLGARPGLAEAQAILAELDAGTAP